MKESRRTFLYKCAGIGALSVLKPWNVMAKGSTKQGTKIDFPAILCSRGETWGDKVTSPGWNVLNDSGDLLTAVVKSTNVVELDPNDYSVGYGGLPNEQGEVELDASIMNGADLNCGSVASLRHIKTASAVARLVMERTDHMMLVGEGALEFARAHGFKQEDLLTDKSRERWLKWKESLSDRDDWLLPKDKNEDDDDRSTGTINVFAVDESGNFAGITSTSGLAFKIPGRVGDSPIIGAGLYVDNEAGAAGATGRGEEVIRTCGSFSIVEMMRQGIHPQEACEHACKRVIRINGGERKVNDRHINVKYVAIDKHGNLGCASIFSIRNDTPKFGYRDRNGFNVYDGTVLIN